SLAKDRRTRFEKRWRKYGRVYGLVSSFARYERARGFDELLWWDVMTRGHHDGTYISDVATFHRSHPHYVFDAALLRGPTVEADEAEAAARAVEADADLDGPDDLRTIDAS